MLLDDALAAGSQFVTHLTGRMLAKLNLHLPRISPASHLHLTCISGVSRQVLRAIEAVGSPSGQPTSEVLIVDCGEL